MGPCALPEWLDALGCRRSTKTLGRVAAATAGANHPGTGCVPSHQGRLEPLAAIYPNQAWAIVREHLETQKASVQEFCRRGLETGWMSRWELSAQDHHTLLNWNTPSDWPGGRPNPVP